MILWAAILSSTKLAPLVKVVAVEAAVADLAAVAGAVVMAAEVVVEEAEVAAVAAAEEAAVVAVTVAIEAAVVAATGAGNSFPTNQNLQRDRGASERSRLYFPQIFSLPQVRSCFMPFVGNSHGHALRRKHPHGSRIKGEARIAAQTRSDAHEATEIQLGGSSN